MVFRLDLTVGDLLQEIGWTEEATDHGLELFPNPDKYELPFTVQLDFEGGYDRLTNIAVELGNYHKHFLRRHGGGLHYINLPNKYLVPFYAEAIENIFRHGELDDSQEQVTHVQLYHTMPAEFVVSICNPNARTWDPAETIAVEGNGGHLTFSKERVTVTYSDSGRVFHAHMRIPES